MLAGRFFPAPARQRGAWFGSRRSPKAFRILTTDCNVASQDVVNTGSRANCKSSWGVFDMVGNVDEWVADWADRANGCTDWTSQTGIAGGEGPLLLRLRAAAGTKEPPAVRRARGDVRPAARE
jgi:formylglycine-generating enzyme required for sulfatase activity